jgi:predicted transcriptional regulator
MLLENLIRKSIYEAVKSEEGIHFRGLQKKLNLKPGTLSHHINVLEKEDYIKSRQDGIYRRFYLYETKPDLKITLTNIQRSILNLVHNCPGISPRLVSEAVGKSRMLVHYHARILNDAGILSIERRGRDIVYYTTSAAMIYFDTPEG